MSKNDEKEMITEKKTEENDKETTPENIHKNKKSSRKSSEGGKVKDKKAEALKDELDEMKDKYLRLYSEFENYRRRTSKEKLDLVSTANEDLMIELLPVIDDFERAIQTFGNETGGDNGLEEGIMLIYNKLRNITEKKGLKAMVTEPGDDFDPEIHDAISHIPAPEDKLKGKIIDTIEKGYYLNSKVIRFAKVVTGA